MKTQSTRQRFQQIVGIFAKYGLKEGITSPPQLRKALEELGPTFIKIAQILSTRPDILSEPYIEEFQKLQDDVKQEEFSAIKEIVEIQLGGNLDDFFAQFDEEPIASASIAQVHGGRLWNGTKVVIKVKRPGIENMIFNDLRLLKHVSALTRFIPRTSVWNPIEVVDELWDSLELELNFLHEAENIQRFREFHKEIKFITIPQIYPEFSTRDVLVMEYIDGIKVYEKNTLAEAGYDLEEICSKIIYNFMYQVFENGFFHADLHPGNILISAKKIAYLDFGLVGHLNQRLRTQFNRLLAGIVQGDLDQMVSSVIQIGVKKGQLDRALLYSEIEQLYNNYISASIYDLDIPRLVEEIFRICRQNRIAFPRDITLLLKGILVLEGLISRLAPGMAIIDLMTPFIHNQIMSSRNTKQELIKFAHGLYRMTRSSLRNPEKLLEILNKAAAGKVAIQLEILHLQEVTADLMKSMNRIVFALVVSSLIIGSSLVIAAEVGPKLITIPILGLAGYIGAAIMGLWLLISIIRSGKI
ncbi:MAG TPA: ABC transporter [Firmicutes bacterium]|jgi:ubiquinone biosynthesis protein|nr:ABC transporter [Bacillota bacterium]